MNAIKTGGFEGFKRPEGIFNFFHPESEGTKYGLMNQLDEGGLH